MAAPGGGGAEEDDRLLPLPPALRGRGWSRGQWSSPNREGWAAASGWCGGSVQTEVHEGLLPKGGLKHGGYGDGLRPSRKASAV